MPYKTKPYLVLGVGRWLRGVEYSIDNIDEPNRRFKETAVFTERASLPLADASATRVAEPSVLSRAVRSALGVGDVQVAGANFSHICRNVADVNAFIAAVEGTHPAVQPRSTRERLLESAIQSGVTGFGDQARANADSLVRTIESGEPYNATVRDYLHKESDGPRTWTVNGNGTVTNERDRQMWIQAPWGMEWQGGSDFAGVPCLLTWSDAQALFGCGVRCALSEAGTIALSVAQILGTKATDGYSRGKCRIRFAGHGDWRLPTIADWVPVAGLGKQLKSVFPYTRVTPERYWTANARAGDWQAPWERDPHCAWSVWPGALFHDSSPHEKKPVMFVRTI